MSKRLIEILKGGKGVYKITEPGIGTWTEVLPLPRQPDNLSSTSPLPVETGPKLNMPGGLYGDREAQRANERRRRVDELLGKRRPRW